MTERKQSNWSSYQEQLHEHMKSGNFGFAATAHKMLAWILLEEEKPSHALMHASVAAYIDANGHCCLDFALQERAARFDPVEVWKPDGQVNIKNLFPLAKAAKALELDPEEVGRSFGEGCRTLFPDTFGAPLSYSEVWATIDESRE